MNRRKVLLGSGVALSTILAGCGGDTSDENGADDSADDDTTDENGADDANGEDNGADDANGEDNGADDGSDENGEDPEEVLEDEDTESTLDGLEILEHELVGDEFSASVEGVVANNTGDELDYVEVGVVLYNADGQRIDDSFTNTTDLPDGEEWAFEVMTMEEMDEIDDYTIAVTDSPF